MKKANMMKTIAFLLCFTMICGFAPAKAANKQASAASLLNPGYEDALNRDGSIPGWDRIYGDNTVFLVTSEDKHSGNNSLKVVDTDNAGSKWMYSTKFDVVPGDTYKATAWVKVLTGAVELCIRYFDSTGIEIGEYPDTTVTSPDWSLQSVQGKVPEGAVKASVFIYSGYGAVSTSYFDDVTFAKVEPEKGSGIRVGTPEDLGEPVKVAMTVGSLIAQTSSGETELYLGTNGDLINNPTTFYVLNAETGEVKFQQQIPGMAHLYGIVQGSDKNIYFSGVDDGILYRYLPDQKRIENLGVNPSNKWVWDLAASKDGKIFGATYPLSKVFEYDIAANSFKDLGTVKVGADYARGIEVTDKYLYVGVGLPDELYRIDRVTGEKVLITTPNTGAAERMTADIWAYNGKLFIRDNAMKLFVLDEQTGAVDLNTSFQQVVSPPCPDNDNIVYFKDKTSLCAYDMTTKTVTKVSGIPPLPDSWTVYFNWVKMTTGEKAGKYVLAIMHEFTEYYLYDPQDNWFKPVPLNLPAPGIEVQSIEKGPDGKLYIGGYQKGMSIYNTETKTIEHNETIFNQPEGIGFLNGKVYFGTYGGAVIYGYDPLQPYNFGYTAANNPTLTYDIGDSQDRPFALESGGNKLFIGSVPEYGILGGALTIFNETANQWTTYRNVVQDQSIIGLAYKDGMLYGGTSVWGGLGIEPTAAEAKVFIWDTVNNIKVKEFTPVIPGIDQTAKMIGDLSFGPDGLLWGVACGTIFAMDPAQDFKVVKSKMVFASDYVNNSNWRPYYLRWGNDGLLYTTVGRNIVVFNPETLACDVLQTDVGLMTLGNDGNIYYSQGSKLYKMTVLSASDILQSVGISLGSNAIARNQTEPLQITAVMSSGLNANLASAQIEYFSSDPKVVSVENGIVKGVKPGTADIWVKVTFYGITVESNKLSVTVSKDRVSTK